MPFRGGSKARERNWAFVSKWWQQFEWPVYSSPGPDGVMNRSAARNQAAAMAGDWDIAVFADADTVGEPDPIRRAVEVAAESGVLSYPFTKFEGLSALQTQRFKAGQRHGHGRRVPYPSPGGILAVTRDLFEQVGGWDEEFVGWGYEDVSFARACRTLAGVERQKGTIFHLWHPPAKEKGDAIYKRTPNRARANLYKAVDGDPEGMRRLLDELRRVPRLDDPSTAGGGPVGRDTAGADPGESDTPLG